MSSLQTLTDVANIHQAAQDPDTAHLMIGGDEVVSSRGTEGLSVETDRVADGVQIVIRVAGGVVIPKPVHMCFGMLQEEGIQRIILNFKAEPESKVDVIAHCVFPNAEDIKHLMDGEIEIAEGASYSYFERHIHSPSGGVLVVPKAKVKVGPHARFATDFELIEGRVGSIDIDYEAQVAAHGVMEMTAKISGKGDDEIRIRETGHLEGEYARGVLTSRVAVRDQASADVYNKLTASAAYARGHVDCKEILKDQGRAAATPIVEVNHPRAHVTHEAALGSVDTRQLQTLMARGLDEDAATDLIIRGLLS